MPDAVEGAEVVPGVRPDLHPLPTKKIGILGTCPSRMLAPFADESWDFWTLGPGGKDANRWSRLFEIHGAGTWPVGAKRLFDQLGMLLGGDKNAWPPGVKEPYQALVAAFEARKADPNPMGLEGFDDYIESLRKEKPPRQIWTLEPLVGCEANFVYPQGAMFAKYGRMWFSSSISYAICLAIEENATDIGCWGIDLESGEEYRVQFMGAKYFLHLARLAGINIHLPKGCGLLRDPNPYPDSWETHLAEACEFKLRYIRGLLAQKHSEHTILGANVNGLEGQLAMLKGDLKPLVPDVDKKIAELEAKIAQGRQQLNDKAVEVHSLNGEQGAFAFMRSLYVIHGDPM